MDKKKQKVVERALEELKEKAESVVGRCDWLLKFIRGEEEVLPEVLQESIKEARQTAEDRTLPMFPKGDSHGSGSNVVDLAAARANRGDASPVVANGVHPDTVSLPMGVAEDGERQYQVDASSGSKEDTRKVSLRFLQDTLVAIIDQHEAALKGSLDQLGCRGDCYKCPVPEEANVDKQVRACLTSVATALSIDLPGRILEELTRVGE